MANSYQHIFTSFMQLLKTPYEQQVFKQLDKRLAQLTQKILALSAKDSLATAKVAKRLHCMFKRTLLLSKQRLDSRLSQYQIQDQSLSHLNLLKHYFDINAKFLSKQQTELEQRCLLDLVDVIALTQKTDKKAPTTELLKAAYQNLLEAYQQKRLPKAQARAQLAVLARLLQLNRSQERQLVRHMLSAAKSNKLPSSALISHPTQPGGSQRVWLYAPHNYIGPPLRHNWHNYFGKPMDNREFLMEKKSSFKAPAQYKRPQLTTGP